MDREFPHLPEVNMKSRKIVPLPVSYTNVAPASFPCDKPLPSKPHGATLLTSTGEIDSEQKQWLEEVSSLLNSGQIHTKLNISWSAYFADKMPSTPRPPAVTGMLPLFRDTAHSPAMVLHAMNVIKSAIQYSNPRQIPVLTVGQPLFAIAKKIQ